MTLGNRIAFHRGRLHLSQQELAEKLNVSRQAVSKWEMDTSTPELEKLVEMGKIFEITLNTLITGAEALSKLSEVETVAPQAQQGNRATVGLICALCGGVGTMLGLFMPLIWVLTIPLLLVGLYLIRPSLALKTGWVLLLLPLVFLRQFTGITLWGIFLPYYYIEGVWNHLLVSYLIWAVILFWTSCAVRSVRWVGDKWLAVGWGAILVVCPDWLSVVYWLQHLDSIATLPLLGLLRVCMSVVIPMAVAFALLRKRK